MGATIRGRFMPILSLLYRQSGDRVVLSFAEIEAMIGAPLSLSAQYSPGEWSCGGVSPFARALRASGWNGRLRIKERRVEFSRSRRAAEGGEA